ncbi:hypothetical protein IWW37_002729 [Coemansia sp. RSA 2050]|nr:hypothetical protein IWW37_002729 [Coemansia sp. RSA 2050]KAJ2736318.1 hypothetical protein IW152_000878 [Coemansia sp. BCRC 34962]
MADRNGRVASSENQPRVPPYKYDIRVTGGLFADSSDNGTTTKVSVKILGNEDGDIVVEQEDSACHLASPALSIDGDTRTPQFSHKRGSDGGLELHIHALPIKPRSTAQPAATLTGGGADANTAVSDAPQLEPSSSRTEEIPPSRAGTRLSVASLNSRPSSSDASVLEIRPAFETPSLKTNTEREFDDAAEALTPRSLEHSPELVLVGGGSGRERDGYRPRSASITVMEDKGTMTTLRGLPTEQRTTNASRCSLPVTIDTDLAFESRKASPTPSVLRGGGAAVIGSRPAQNPSVFSAFNGPLVAPPENGMGGRSGARPRSLPRNHDQLRPRRTSKDKINYRERAENLLTQYFPAEVLERYLDELRRRYRFIGDGGMTNSEISKLLDETTADSQLREQLRASLEELVKAPMASGYSSDHEHTISSSPSQKHYLSIRETELRDVLDRTSVSPVPKAVRSTGAGSVLVGGGMSMEDLGSPSLGPHISGTLRSDQISLAASVHPAESVCAEPKSSSTGGSRGTTSNQKAPGPQQQQQQQQQHAKAAPGGPSKTGPGYWDDNEKYKMRPPNMAQAFTILKSQPIFVREMSSSDIKFKSPFSRTTGDSSPSAATEMPSMGESSPKAEAKNFASTDAFAERHPAESKVAKAVSELEEVLRRTEAETLAGIASDFQSSNSSSKDSHHSRSNGDNYDTESIASRDSLVGGGASSRSASVSTRYSAMESKFGNVRPDSAFKMSASQSTIRTDVLLKEGMEFGDADNIDKEMIEEDEAVVPVEPDSLNSSAVSLPMRLEDMPPELAAVLRRTGGIENARLRRTETPSTVSSASHRSSPSVAERQSLKGGAVVSNKSLTELDIVMGRTGGPGNRSVASSRTGTPTSNSVLRGGSGTPLTPGDAGDELANVLRRTSGYAPSVSSYAPSVASSVGRPDSAASDIKSVAAPEPARQSMSSASSNVRPGYAHSGRQESSPAKPVEGYKSPVPLPRAAAQSPSRSAARSPAASYASSPLRAPAHQPAQRYSPPPHSQPAQRQSPLPYSQPAQRAPSQQPRREEQAAPSARSPSPELYRLPTPVFGRFPSPPAYIKNRGKVPEAAAEAQATGNGNSGEPSQPQPRSPSPTRGRPHSHSVHQEQPRPQAHQYQEEPVVDRLDLETGSVASRRAQPKPASIFGSASTLMNANIRENYDLPKVVEEDVDSLASYPTSRRTRSPNLVGGGRLHPSEAVPSTRSPSVLCGGSGDAHHTSTSAKSCEAGCCGVCGKDVNKNDVVVRPQVMHASCLRCEACDCLLTSSTFRAINGHVYCESDYQRHFTSKDGAPSSPNSKVVAVRPGISDKQFRDMNKAIMESFTSVDDFLQHMRQLRQKGDQPAAADKVTAYAGDPAKVQRAGDVGVDRQTHYEREHVTSPSGTDWITERVVDKKVKTKVIEKRYPASAVSGQSQPPSIKCGGSVPPPARTITEDVGSTLIGGGSSNCGGDTIVQPRSNSSRMDAMRSTNHSSASRPSNALLNDTKAVNGWEHPMCPVCAHVIYQNDQVVHEGYGYHKACMRCCQCSQVVPVISAIRIKGAIYCKKHGGELLRRRSILMRKKSTMSRRSRHTRQRSAVSSEGFAANDSASLPAPPPPPMPDMPMFSSSASASPMGLPVPPAMPGAGVPRRVTTALRNFLEAAAEQIENQSLLPVSPEPMSMSPARSIVTELPKSSRPLPQPKPKAAQGHQPHLYQPMSVPNYVPAPPSQPPPSGQRPGSRSIFSGSRESFYDPNVVNALRQEAQRQINGSNASLVAPSSPAVSITAEKTRRLLSPCGPSIADALHRYNSGSHDGRVSVSSHFDPFLESSHDQLVGGGGRSPQRQQHSGAPSFLPNQQLDNLERRFRNANFRPPWALKSQSTFE